MKLNVLLVSDQVRGIDGTGGLGDVATGLARELAERDDTDIRVLMPGYEQISERGHEKRFEDVIFDDLVIPWGAGTRQLSVSRYRLPQFHANETPVTCYLLRQPELLARRENSAAQAVLLAQGTLAFLERFTEFRPDVLHCNDWHTGLIPVYINSVYKGHPFLGRLATLYTVHNNGGDAYQGAKDFGEVETLAGIPSEYYLPGRTRSVEHWGRFNFAKGGIGFADLVNTVSLTYAQEMRSRVMGGGLEQVVESRAHNICGIVNGIDTDEWNSETDHYLPENCRFSPTDPVEWIQRKKIKIRQHLRAWTAPDGGKPFANVRDDSVLIGLITRITDQKMPAIVPLAEDMGFGWDGQTPVEKLCLENKDVQFAVLGNADRTDHRGQRYVAKLEEMQRKLPQQCHYYNGFDIGLSHLLFATTDIMLVPSVFEPCGLTQLTGMRYGTVPLVRGVGGLRDTVIDEQASPHANGFSFLEFQGPVSHWPGMIHVSQAADLCLQTMRRALGVRKSSEARWHELMRNGLNRDSSWNVPVRQYRLLYEAALNHRIHHFFCAPATLESVQIDMARQFKKIERLLSMPADVFMNLRKLESGSFGPYEMTEGFRLQLRDLETAGLVELQTPDIVPYRGMNLSQHAQITAEGREFIRQRLAL
ncbi:MAG: glycogen/starch synthase [Planctomycetales bacterium]